MFSNRSKANVNQDLSHAIQLSAVERLRDVADGISRGVKSLIELGYPGRDRLTVEQVSSGLSLDHVGLLLPLPWSQVKEFVEAFFGSPVRKEQVPSVIVKNRLMSRMKIDLPVTINFITLEDTSHPKLEIFTVECNPFAYCRERLARLNDSSEFHLAFNVDKEDYPKATQRLKNCGLESAATGTHIFTGQKVNYYHLGGVFNRHFEMLT